MQSTCLSAIASKLRNCETIHFLTNTCRRVILSKSYSTIRAMAEVEPSDNDNKVTNKQRTRYNGRIKKRSWEERGTEGGKKLKEGDEPFVRIKKKKMAVLLGYSGVNYFGMQRNPLVHTIEEELLTAFLKADYIDKEGFDCMQQIDFQRAARTDKGVSAVRQIVSVKLPLEAVPEKVNEHLPDCIRVFGIKRVTKGFNSKTNCDARTYSYTLPSFAFDPSVHTEDERKAYRIQQAKIDEIDDVLSVYKTKNYHNFTAKKAFTDPSCIRYIMSFKVDKVFVQSDMEFVLLKVKGQSFMLHQIRKMVGLVLAVIRGVTSKEMLEKAFLEERIRLPTAPGLGLLLEQVHYDRYNTRYGKDGVHATLDWTELYDVTEKFKMDYILPNTVKTEIAENSMGIWLEDLQKHNFVIGDNQNFDDKEDESEEDDDEPNNVEEIK